ncbi:MAG: AgmX/PglI C-terminal domain-containing protein, partial [Myxococcota bacterium]
RLLEGTAHPRATAFGAAEKSESRVRPLPLQPEAVHAVPLRDAVAPRGPGITGLIGAILAGFALCGLVVAGIYLFFFRPSKPSAPVPAAAATAPPSAVREAVAPPPQMPVPEPELAVPPPPAAAQKEEEKPRTTKKTRRRRPRSRQEPAPEAVSQRRPEPPPSRDLDDESLINPTGNRRRSAPKTLDETDILGVLRKNRASVRTCLRDHQVSGSRVFGTMTVYMVVRNSGRPTRISVSPKFRNTVAGTCIVDTVKTWRFPKSAGDNLPVDFPVNVRGS